MHCTRFSKGKGDFLQGSWWGVEGPTQCLPWAVTGTVSMQGCFPEECIPNFGCVCINVSCTKGLNTVLFEYGDIFLHLFFYLCPLRSQVSVWIFKQVQFMIGETINGYIPVILEGMRDFQLTVADLRDLDTFQIISHIWELTTLALNSWAWCTCEMTVLPCQLSRCTHSTGQISQRLLICWGIALLLFCLFA